MDKQDEYRRNAEYAQHMADHAGMAEDRASWLRIAAGWLSLLRGKKTGDGYEKSQQDFDEQFRELGIHQKDSGASH
jgi:hypothetical protein